MGTMSLLVTHGGYQLSLTDRAYLGFGSSDRRPRIPDIGRGAAAECTRRIPSTARTTMAANSAYQAELAKEHDHILARENKGTSSDATTGDHQ